jgi:hypothetical protein
MSEPRKLQIELIFRDANERIRRASRELDAVDPLPFLCECIEPACRQIVQLSAAEYDAVRSGDRCFLIAPGHDHEEGDVIERQGSHWILRKR